MILSDYHVHTSFSTDSDTPAEVQIETLLSKGITEICITDHEDIGYAGHEEDFGNELPFRLDPFTYYETIASLIPRYRDRAKLHVGIELGLRTDYFHSITDFANVCPWEFIIGSTHVVSGIDPYYPEYWTGRTKKQGILEYYEDTLENIKKFDCFDVYGHIDYIIRYAPGKTENYNRADYSDVIDKILRTLISKGKGIECNTAGFKYGLGMPNPEVSILSRYRELGGEILTVGSDGHKPEHVAYDFEKVPKILKDCGFRYYTVFRDRKPIMLPL